MNLELGNKLTPLEFEALMRARDGERTEVVGGTLMPADLAEKEREFNETKGEVASLSWATPEADAPRESEAPVQESEAPVDGDRLAAIYEAAGVPPEARPAPVQRAVPEEPDPGPAQPAVLGGSPAMPCQRCGYVPGTSLMDEPTVEDQRAFVHSILGRKRFIRNFHFFGPTGGMQAVFQNVLPAEYDVIRKVMQWMIRSGDARTVDDQFVFQQTAVAIVSALGANLTEKERRDFEPPDIVALYEEARARRKEAVANGAKSEPDPEEAVYEEINRRAVDLGPVVLILTQGSYRMEELYRMLVARAYDQDFWLGASGA